MMTQLTRKPVLPIRQNAKRNKSYRLLESARIVPSILILTMRNYNVFQIRTIVQYLKFLTQKVNAKNAIIIIRQMKR